VRALHIAAALLGALIGALIDAVLPDSGVKILAYVFAYVIPLSVLPFLPVQREQVWQSPDNPSFRVKVTTELTNTEARRTGTGLIAIYFVIGGLAGTCIHIFARLYA
jgi:hypothetical protein